ncbi:hypothetical protein [Sulfurimonas sp.]|uniref:hypothetical protein n=1 Tax=Sulfurimonas sp. TaxID=2022749 RepID=UPI002B487D2F|nr:hypothetical protein [Sulfurimonas sp.]
MIDINWVEFKEYKEHSVKDDNFEILLDFIKSYYNMSNPIEVYDTLREDSTGRLMLKKRDITDAEGLENFMFQQ